MVWILLFLKNKKTADRIKPDKYKKEEP